MNCKNCNFPTENNFCNQCGQKTSTQRITWHNWIQNDILLGVFNLDRGLPQTWFKIITQPAQVAHQYIEGKRKRFYNFFYLLLLLVGLKLYLNDTFPEVFAAKQVDGKKNFMAIVGQNMQLWIVSIIPLFSLVSWLLYRRIKYNFLEHAIQAAVTLIGSFSFLLIYNVVLVLDVKYETSFLWVFSTIFILITFIGFPLFSYYQFSAKANYTRLGKIVRVLLFYVLFVALFFLYSLIFNYFFTGNIKGYRISI